MMAYDSRRWTGRYGPGETPPEFAGGRPYRSRNLRWWLVAAVLGSIAIAILQIFAPVAADGLPFGWFVIGALLNVPAGRSPFARSRRGTDPPYDEFERAAVMQATGRAYVAIALLATAALAWCAFASANGWPMPRRWGDWAIWAFALAAIASNLPALFAEFAIPFPAEDDGS